MKALKWEGPGHTGMWVGGAFPHAQGWTVPETLLSASHELSPQDPHSSLGGNWCSVWSGCADQDTQARRGPGICKQARGRQVGRTQVPERQGTLIGFYGVTTGTLLDMWTHWRGGA